jgi:hypothetical protein
MKIAYCLSGCIGGLTGKAMEKTSGSEKVLDIASNLFFKNVKSDVDIFIYSWDTHLHKQYESIYNPKRIVTRDQIKFDISGNDSGNPRFQAHYSRWFTTKKVLELKTQYESEYGAYDLVISTRLDLAWIKPVNFETLNTSKVNFDQAIFHNKPYGTETSVEIGDRFIASNSETMNDISKIYDKLSEYTTSIKKMWRRISSHYIIPHHLAKLNIRKDVDFPYLFWHPTYNQPYEDSHCVLVRDLKK